jgi:hypothetical protein
MLSRAGTLKRSSLPNCDAFETEPHRDDLLSLHPAQRRFTVSRSRKRSFHPWDA